MNEYPNEVDKDTERPAFSSDEAEKLPAAPVSQTETVQDNHEPGGDEPALGFLELFYGILFEPGKTMPKVAQKPPLGLALLMVTILGLAGMVMWFFTSARLLNQGSAYAIPGQFASSLLALGAVVIFLWGYIKWFSYSAFISLAAEMLGGVGSARGVAAVVGLALIPSILIIPVQLLNYHLASTVFLIISALIVWTWVAVLMVIGVKEIHSLSTGRACLAVLSPLLVLGVFLGLVLAGLVAVGVDMFSGGSLPGYF